MSETGYSAAEGNGLGLLAHSHGAGQPIDMEAHAHDFLRSLDLAATFVDEEPSVPLQKQAHPCVKCCTILSIVSALFLVCVCTMR